MNVVTSLSSGYQYHSNLTEYRSGVSDISPKVQVNFGSFYVSFMDMIRPDSSLWDAPGAFGSSAAYRDSNRRDGRVDDPSKVHGSKNQAVVDAISNGQLLASVTNVSASYSLPFQFEPIERDDVDTQYSKNDCELNAAKRLLVSKSS